jgi:hypothetical protein
MADYFYKYKIVSCRGKHDTAAVGNNDFVDNSVPFRPVYEYTTTVTEANPASALFELIGELQVNMAASEATLVSKIDTSSSKPWYVAVNNSLGSSGDDSTVATEGVWYQRIGKDVLRHEIGFSDNDAAGAVTNLTAKNLV